MFKESFKTYWKNMKYFIMVLGILFLTLLISTSFVARSTYNSISVISEELAKYISLHNMSFEPIAQSFQGNGNFFTALGGVIGTYAGFAGELVSELGLGVVKIAGALLVFVILSVIGIFISHDVVFILSRYSREANNILEVWFELYVKNVLIIIALVLIAYFLSVPFLNKLGLVLLILFPITYCILSLIGEWIAAGRERPAFKNVVNVKNVCILFAENIIVLLISLAIAAVIFLLFGALVGFYSGLTLLILAAVSISLNAQAFVFGENSWVNYLPDEVEKKEEEKPAEE